MIGSSSQRGYWANLWRSDWPILALFVAGLGVGAWAYPRLPERAPIHWNIHGQADGFGSPFMAAFFLPLISIGVYALLAVIPLIDPKRENYPRFAQAYRWLRLGLMAFLFLLYGTTLAAGLNLLTVVDRAIPMGLGLFTVLIGVLLPRLESNYFVGIRTPWTLADPEIWRRTHRTSGPIWVVAGVIGILGALLGGAVAMLLSIVPILAAAAFSIAYSFVVFRQVRS